jgi:hypothetical protein
MLEQARTFWAGVMMRIGTAANLLALAGVFSLLTLPANGQSATPEIRLAQAVPQDQPVPHRLHRPPARLRVYPNYEPDEVYPYYYPGPNAVRVCNATYVQQYRPSGTVIVPRLTCYWRRGY